MTQFKIYTFLLFFIIVFVVDPTNISLVVRKPESNIVQTKTFKETTEIPKEKPQQNKKIIMEVTAYTAGKESTSKTPSHPEYGITASGSKVRPHRTIAASRSIPFGTRLRIPEYEKFMGLDETILVVEDRGGAITKGKLDVYIEDLDTALEWGRREVEVIFID